jgi:NADP-dependent 3-hydroxy acid dehydrogenase YdfG
MDTKVSRLDPTLLRLVVDMNLFGTVYAVVNAVAPTMNERRSGKIIVRRGYRARHDRDRPNQGNGYSWQQPEQSGPI